MRKQHGFSLIELLIVVAIILVISAIAIPNLMKSRIAANEASAVGSLRALNTAETTYNLTYNNSFTCTLSDLGPPGSGVLASSSAAGLIDGSLASGSKSGYTFTPGTCTTTGSGAISLYQWLADPTSPGTSGSRHFCTSDTFTIKVDPNSSANCLTIGSPVG
ncbi:MAG TPA: type II secretion system protein [Terriglobales bacterium]|jgi:prepilin-type N-terminal cleavage/methylation domain-containing protein|nr:type II secretion system protein [Terriglobales bacterium]